MSYQAMNLVSQLKKCDIEEINNTKFTSGVKCLLFAMANYCDERFQFYPSRQTLADDVGCCVKAIDNYNNYLIKLGLIAKVTRKGKSGNTSNLYELKIGAFLTKHGYLITMNEKGFLRATKQKHTHSPLESRGEIDSLGGEMVTLGGEMVTPDPITEPITESKDLITSSPDDEQDALKIVNVEIEFTRLWLVWPNAKNKIRSVSAFKTFIKGKSPNAITLLVDSLIIDTKARLKAYQLGFDKMMLSTYLNNRRFDDDITNQNNESVDKVSMDKEASAAKGRELFNL